MNPKTEAIRNMSIKQLIDTDPPQLTISIPSFSSRVREALGKVISLEKLRGNNKISFLNG